jgi:hypothetical protein
MIRANFSKDKRFVVHLLNRCAMQRGDVSVRAMSGAHVTWKKMRPASVRYTPTSHPPTSLSSHDSPDQTDGAARLLFIRLAISIWSVSVIPNGDIVTGDSDSIICISAKARDDGLTSGVEGFR